MMMNISTIASHCAYLPSDMMFGHRTTPVNPGHFHFCTHLPITARSIGLAIGRFKQHSIATDVSQSSTVGGCNHLRRGFSSTSLHVRPTTPSSASISRIDSTVSPSHPEISAYFLPEGYGGWLGLCKTEELEREKLSADVLDGRKRRRRKCNSIRICEAVKFLLRPLLQAIQYLAKWLDVTYPYGETQFVFVSGLRGSYSAFGGLILLNSNLLCGSNVPESDIPILARYAAVEGMLFGWIQDAIRLKGGGYRWIQLGLISYLREKWGEEFYGTEEAQYRRWRAMRELIRLDQEIGSPCINPPDPDAYILDVMDPTVISFTILKSEVLFNLLESRLGMPVLRLALQTLVRWLDGETSRQPLPYPGVPPLVDDVDTSSNGSIKKEEKNLRVLPIPERTAATDANDSSSAALPPAEVVVEKQMKENNVNENGSEDDGDACTRVQKWESELFRTGSSPLLLLDNYQFFRSLKNEAMAAGEDTGTDLTESFVQRWVTGQGVAFFCCGGMYNKKQQVEVVLEQVVPPWQEGYQSGGPLGIEIWEAEGCWKYSEKIEPAQQCSLVYPMHSKPRRRKIERKVKGRGGGKVEEDSMHNKSDKMSNGGRGGAGEFGTTTSGAATTVTSKPMLPSIQHPSSDVHELHTDSISDARDANSTPVLWIKVDPKMLWIRSILLRQPDYQWVEQLFCDTGVAGQADAIIGLLYVHSLLLLLTGW